MTFKTSMVHVADQIDSYLRIDLDFPMPDKYVKPNSRVKKFMVEILNSISDVHDRKAAPLTLLPAFSEWEYFDSNIVRRAREQFLVAIGERRTPHTAAAQEYGQITDEHLFRWLIAHPEEMAKIDGIVTTDRMLELFKEFWLSQLNRVLAHTQSEAIRIDNQEDVDPEDDEERWHPHR